LLLLLSWFISVVALLPRLRLLSGQPLR